MNHPIYRILKCKAVGPYTLDILFNDGAHRIVDLEAVLQGELYAPLRDPEIFEQVSVDAETGVPIWPGGADFDPAVLHDWDSHKADFEAAALRW
jgi:hypothetical protein